MLVADNFDPGAAPAKRWSFAVTASILGWVLDAFDFFILIFLLDVLAAHFHVDKRAIIRTITFTLLARPVGAVMLGTLADRYGRRRPLLLCVVYFSLVTALTPFAPSYAAFVVLRTLYGIGMGGYWGIGASLVMESAPTRLRGIFSGIMQAGYPTGYLLAAVAMRSIQPHLGWQALFLCGLLIAAVIVVLTMLAPESAAWQRSRAGSLREILGAVATHKKRFGYLVLLMTAMTCLSHGTQDLYPDFLKSMHHISSAAVSNLAILYNVGAVVGALAVGRFSASLGRRRCIMVSLCISLLAIPAWAFGSTIGLLAAGSFAMQFGVQGAFGMVPVHLNELSPPGVRSLFPGLTYQLGTVFSAPCVVIEDTLHAHLGYSWALCVFEFCVIAALFVLYALGPQAPVKLTRTEQTHA